MILHSCNYLSLQFYLLNTGSIRFRHIAQSDRGCRSPLLFNGGYFNAFSQRLCISRMSQFSVKCQSEEAPFRPGRIITAGRVVLFYVQGRKMEVQHGGGCWNDSRLEEHTSELQSLMRISYAVFCLTKKNKNNI